MKKEDSWINRCRHVRAEAIDLYILPFLIFLNAASLVWSAYMLRPLAGEGAPWVFLGTISQSFHYDHLFARYLNMILQVPGLAYLNITQNPGPSIYLHMFIYGLTCLLSLVVCFKMLRRRSRSDLFVFPLVAFALINMTISVQPYDLVTDVVALAWPLAICVLMKRRQWQDWTTVLILTAALAMSHETGMGILLVLGVLSAVESVRLKSRKEAAIAGILFAGAAWLIYRAFGPTAGDKSHFVQQISSEYSVVFVVSSLTAIAFSLLLIKSDEWIEQNRKRILLFSALILSAGFYLSLSELTYETFSGARTARIFAVPLTAVLLLMLYLKLRSEESASPTEIREELRQRVFGGRGVGVLNRTLGVLLCFVLAYSAASDLRLTLRWQRAIENILALQDSDEACLEMKLETARRKFVQLGMSSREHPALAAIVSQVKLGEVRAVFGNIESRVSDEHVCCSLARGNLPVYNRDVPVGSVRTFNFEKIIAYAAKNSAQLGCRQ